MKRFIVALALVALGAALYVTAAPGSRQAGTVSLLRQVKTLQKQVKALQKQVKTDTQDINGLGGFVATCMAHQPVAVSQMGTAGTNGYLFGPPQTAPNAVTASATTALDLDASGTPQFRLYAVNTSNSTCVTIVQQLASHGPGYVPRLAPQP